MRSMSGRGGRRVCEFFLRGSCKFGDGCRNEHPRQGTSYDGRDNDRNANNPRQQPEAHKSAPALPYNLSKDTIIIDLKDEKPTWPFSAYGPGKNAPRQLFEGSIEQSPEEMRMAYYLAQAAGNTQPAIQAEHELLNTAQRQTQQALNNVDAAMQYIIDGADLHPNRLDMQQLEQAASLSNPFAANASAHSGFGATSFGQASTSQLASFGQPSGVGSNSAATSGFGHLSTTTVTNPTAFGRPSLPGSAPAFGNSSLPTNNPLFANAVATQATAASPFAQSKSPFAGSQPSSNPSPFANAMRSTNSSQNMQQPAANPSPFGQQNAVTSSPFTQHTGNTGSPFAVVAQPPQSAANGSGTKASTAINPFDQNSTAALQSQPGLSMTGTSYNVISTANGSQPQQKNFASTAGLGQSNYIQYNHDKNVVAFKGQHVRYIDHEPLYRRPDTGQETRLWFPDGPPATPNRYGSEVDEVYIAAGDTIEAMYKHVAETGLFKDGIMPELAPKAQWIQYDI